MRDAGDLDGALGLLAGVETGALDELERARVDPPASARSRWSNGAAPTPAGFFWVRRVRLQPVDPDLARETYLEALGGVLTSDVQVIGGVQAVAAAAQSAPPGTGPPRCVDVLLDAFAARLTDGYTAAAPILRTSSRARGGRRPSLRRRCRSVAVIVERPG